MRDEPATRQPHALVVSHPDRGTAAYARFLRSLDSLHPCDRPQLEGKEPEPIRRRAFSSGRLVVAAGGCEEGRPRRRAESEHLAQLGEPQLVLARRVERKRRLAAVGERQRQPPTATVLDGRTLERDGHPGGASRRLVLGGPEAQRGRLVAQHTPVAAGAKPEAPGLADPAAETLGAH
eukprot:938241-Prymnesium_polylepis.1